MNEEMSRYLYQKLEKIISYLAYENKDFVCSACLHTMDELYDMARYMLSFATACDLKDMADEIMEVDEDE